MYQPSTIQHSGPVPLIPERPFVNVIATDKQTRDALLLMTTIAVLSITKRKSKTHDVWFGCDQEVPERAETRLNSIYFRLFNIILDFETSARIKFF